MYLPLISNFHPVLKNWLNNLSFSPSNDVVKAQQILIKGIADDLILPELDLFHTIGGLETDEQRLRPLITTSATKTFTAISSPTLNINGVTGNGVNSYIQSNWIPSTNGIKYTQNSASFGVYLNSANVTANSDEMSVTDGTRYCYMNARYSTNNFFTVVNAAAATEFGTSNLNSQGLFSNVRTASNAATNYINSVQGTASAGASNGLPTTQFYILAQNNNGTAGRFSVRRLAMIYCGSGAINQLSFYNRIQTYMTSRGIQV